MISDANTNSAGVGRVVERLDPQPVSGAEQASVRIVPDGERKHAVEPVEAVFPPFDVRVQQNLGIGSRREHVPSDSSSDLISRWL